MASATDNMQLTWLLLQIICNYQTKIDYSDERIDITIAIIEYEFLNSQWFELKLLFAGYVFDSMIVHNSYQNQHRCLHCLYNFRDRRVQLQPLSTRNMH